MDVVMTTNRQYDDHEGEFRSWQDSSQKCRKTKADGTPCDAKVEYRLWESSDGAYEDWQYRCEAGHTWWVDGIDS